MDGDQDVDRSANCKEQMTDRHCGSAPERQEPTDIQRMPNVFVRSGSRELDWSVFFASEVQPWLSQSEQVKVIDQECRNQDRQPAGYENSPGYSNENWVCEMPDLNTHRLPEPEQQSQGNAGGQTVVPLARE